MICRECGEDVVAESVFCHKCGARLDVREPAEMAGTLSADPPKPSPEEQPSDAPADPSSASSPKNSALFKPNTSGSHDDDLEHELWTGGYSPKAMFGAFLGAGLATIAGVILAIFTGLWPIVLGAIALLWIGLAGNLAYRRLSVDYRLTNHRLFHRKGLLRRVTDRIEVIDIDDVTSTQGIVERFLNVGSVKINSSDKTHPELFLIGIEDVDRVASMVDDARRAERTRRGVYVESV